jgi:hypothetical protein
MAKLNLPPKAAGSDPGVAWKVLEFCSIRHKRIARIFALRDCGEIDALGKLEGDVFQTMNGKINAPIEECFVEFFGKEAFAADLGQRDVENFVARGFYGNEVNDEAGPSLLELRFGPICLP